jgi:transposase
MRFYTKTHQYYCGIDLHTRWMYLCILNQQGEILFHKNLKACPESFLKAVAPYRQDLVVAVECIFSWYWLADLCAEEGIHFVLGHALYMKAIHGGKAKNDKIDSSKIAILLRGGNIPQAYVYPPQMRATRDLLRRRTRLVRKRAELLGHIQNTNSQYNLPPFGKNIEYPGNREGRVERFTDPMVQASIQTDFALIDFYSQQIAPLEQLILSQAKDHDPQTFYLLQSVPGIGKILALVILYEIHDLARFKNVQQFVSYCRLVKCAQQSVGKIYGFSGSKIGNAHLKWAFSEAAVGFLRHNPPGQKLLAQLKKKHGKGKSLTILAHKLGRAVYFLWRREEVFDLNTFLAA